MMMINLSEIQRHFLISDKYAIILTIILTGVTVAIKDKISIFVRVLKCYANTVLFLFTCV